MSTREFVKLSSKGLPSRAHTCVVFGGWGGAAGGEEEIPYDGSGAARFAERARALGLTVKDWQGAMKTSEMMGQVLTFIRENFTPKGKLIIYGYSAGGVNALDVARELDRRPQSLSMAKIAREPSAPKPDVVVDLLITIDAYRSGVTESDRRVPSNVARSINIYQGHKQRLTGSHGAPSWRSKGDEGSHDCNQDRSERKEYKERGRGPPGGGAHHYIDDDTEVVAFQKLEALINGGPDAVDCNLG